MGSLVNMGKHSSLEPIILFFQIKDKNTSTTTPKSTDGGSAGSSSSSAAASVSSAQSACISLTKRSNLRSQYMTNEGVVFSIGLWSTNKRGV